MTIRRANSKFSHRKHTLRRHAKPKHALVGFFFFSLQPSSNSPPNKLAAYFVHTFCNLGIACAILHRHTCDNTLQSAPSALICKAQTCCRRTCMLFCSSLAACPCGFFFSPLLYSLLPFTPRTLRHPPQLHEAKREYGGNQFCFSSSFLPSLSGEHVSAEQRAEEPC